MHSSINEHTNQVFVTAKKPARREEKPISDAPLLSGDNWTDIDRLRNESPLEAAFSTTDPHHDGPTRAYSGISISGSAIVHLGDVYHQDTARRHDELLKARHSFEIKAIANWFSANHFASRNNDLIACREKACGLWFLNHQRFLSWRDDRNASLICRGKPGCGKTMMMATIIQQLYQENEHKPDVATVYLYFDTSRHTKQTFQHMLAALIRQLFQEQASIPEAVSKVYLRHCKRHSRPSVDELRSLLRTLVQEYNRVFILIDALDECSNIGRCRDLLLEEIYNMQNCSMGNICMLATTQNIPDILRRFPIKAQFEFQARDEDIQHYLTARMPELARCVRRDENLQREIMSHILASVDGIFLLARLHLDALLDQTTPRQIRSVLRNLSRGPAALQQAYDKARKHIDQQLKGFRCLARKVLAWVTLARRELTIEELQEAVAIEPDMDELDQDNDLADEDTIVSVCMGLLSVSRERRVVRFIHGTVQEYFHSICAAWVPEGQTMITQSCLTYLSMPRSVQPALREGTIFGIDLTESFIKYKFLQYAGQNWGFHLAQTDDVAVYAQARALLYDNERLAYASAVMLAEQTLMRNYVCLTKETTPLLVCVWFGMWSTAQSLITNNTDYSQQDSRGRTLLSWAAEKGHTEIVDNLLAQKGLDINVKDKMGRTTLSWAAEAGHTAIVESLLLRTDIEADVRDDYGRTPLSLAAQNGHVGTIELLIDRRDVEIDMEDENGGTPLSWAVVCGHTAIVRLLLARSKLSLNRKDKDGRSLLSWAAEDGHIEIVQLLLAQAGIEADITDSDGMTPLSQASANGHTDVVELLLARPDVQADSEDEGSRTPLLWAAQNGHIGIVALLLARKEVSWDVIDEDGGTPLSWAIQNGHGRVVQHLFARAALEAEADWEHFLEEEMTTVSLD